MEVRNRENELLDTSFDGSDIHSAKTIVVFNHGLGTDKHERGIFDGIVESLENETRDAAFLRFSYSGFGESEGKQEEKTLDTMAEDLLSVWKFVDQNKATDAVVKTISFSIGNQILTKALTKNHFDIETMVCVNPSKFFTGEENRKRWASRPGVKYDDNIMLIPRADGTVSKIGREYWSSIDPILYKNKLTEAAREYNSVLICAADDDIAKNPEVFELPFKEVFEIHGDHSYSKPDDRKVFMQTIGNVIVGDAIESG